MTFCCRMNSDTVDYDDACLIVRYLASMRPFAQSFDIYLTQVKWIRIPYTMILIFLVLDLWGSVWCLFIIENRYIKNHVSSIYLCVPYLFKCLCSTCLLHGYITVEVCTLIDRMIDVVKMLFKYHQILFK